MLPEGNVMTKAGALLLHSLTFLNSRICHTRMMERRPFNIKEPTPGKRFVKALPFILIWFLIAPLMALTLSSRVDPIVR
jgi:hypothetical protein